MWGIPVRPDNPMQVAIPLHPEFGRVLPKHCLECTIKPFVKVRMVGLYLVIPNRLQTSFIRYNSRASCAPNTGMISSTRIRTTLSVFWSGIGITGKIVLEDNSVFVSSLHLGQIHNINPQNVKRRTHWDGLQWWFPRACFSCHHRALEATTTVCVHILVHSFSPPGTRQCHGNPL